LEREQEKQNYAQTEPIYRQLVQAVEQLLEKRLHEGGIHIHEIQGRVKEFDSYWAKFERKSKHQFFVPSMIHDIAGVRIVCLFLSQLAQIDELIQDTFIVIREDNKVEDALPSSFGYLSNHYTVNLPAEHSGGQRTELHSLECEIQVRTISMDAWASISRALAYNSIVDVPDELMRDFNAISALLHIADKEFENIYREVQLYRDAMYDDAAKQRDLLLRQKLNLDSLTAYLAEVWEHHQRPSREATSVLLRLLKQARYKTIRQLDETLFEEIHHAVSEARMLDYMSHDAAYVVRDRLGRVDKRFEAISDDDWKSQAEELEADVAEDRDL
jgi:putative GTP pyrophosphokinase